jgi:regulatory protein
VWQHEGEMNRPRNQSKAGKQGKERQPRKPPPPIDSQRLTDIAYGYAARFAVTEARLKRYLSGKVRERGWAEEVAVVDVIDRLVARLVEFGAVNDVVVARSTVDLSRRKGLAGHRIRTALSMRQVSAETATEVLAETQPDDPEAAALEAAQRYAQRKRLGQWRTGAASPERDRREMAAMIRGGHSFSVARAALRMTIDELE